MEETREMRLRLRRWDGEKAWMRHWWWWWWWWWQCRFILCIWSEGASTKRSFFHSERRGINSILPNKNYPLASSSRPSSLLLPFVRSVIDFLWHVDITRERTRASKPMTGDSCDGRNMKTAMLVYKEALGALTQQQQQCGVHSIWTYILASTVNSIGEQSMIEIDLYDYQWRFFLWF
jgi:hypothetical protein